MDFPASELPPQTLLLNASFEPLAAVSLPRAVSLMMADKIDVLAASDGAVRSASMTLPVPSVLKLRYYVNVPRRRDPALTKRNVLARDRHICGYCGAAGRTVDHIIPRSRGGLHEWENVVAACHRCNGRKGSSLLSELGWVLNIQPHRPSATPWWPVGHTNAAWEPFLEYG